MPKVISQMYLTHLLFFCGMLTRILYFTPCHKESNREAVCEAEETKIQTEKKKIRNCTSKKSRDREREKREHTAKIERILGSNAWKEKKEKKETTESVLSTALFSMDDASNAGVRREKKNQNKTKQNWRKCMFIYNGAFGAMAAATAALVTLRLTYKIQLLFFLPSIGLSLAFFCAVVVIYSTSWKLLHSANKLYCVWNEVFQCRCMCFVCTFEQPK